MEKSFKLIFYLNVIKLLYFFALLLLRRFRILLLEFYYCDLNDLLFDPISSVDNTNSSSAFKCCTWPLLYYELKKKPLLRCIHHFKSDLINIRDGVINPQNYNLNEF